jgi:hypothetical protein
MVEGGLETMGNNDHLYDVTKDIQDAMLKLRTDRFRQAKINRLQAKVNVEPGKSIDDGTLDLLNQLVDQDWQEYHDEIARLNRLSKNILNEDQTIMSKEEEALRHEIRHKTEVYQRLIRSDPPGRIVEFGFEEGGDDYSILTGSTYVDTTDDTATQLDPDILMTEATPSTPTNESVESASNSAIIQVPEPTNASCDGLITTTSLGRVALKSEPFSTVEGSYFVPIQPNEATSVNLHSSTSLPHNTEQTPANTIDMTDDSIIATTNNEPHTTDMTVDSSDTTAQYNSPNQSHHRGSHDASLSPATIKAISATSFDSPVHSTEQWISNRKKQNAKSKPKLTSATTTAIERGRGHIEPPTTNRYAALAVDDLLEMSLKQTPPPGTRPNWYDDDSSNEEDPNSADSSSAYDGTSNTPESDDDISMSDYDPTTREVTDPPFESEEVTAAGYDTDTTSNRRKRSPDPQSITMASMLETGDMTAITPTTPQVRISNTSLSTPYGIRQTTPDVKADINTSSNTTPDQTLPRRNSSQDSDILAKSSIQPVFQRSPSTLSNKPIKKQDKLRGVSKGPARLSKPKKHISTKRKSVDPDQSTADIQQPIEPPSPMAEHRAAYLNSIHEATPEPSPFRLIRMPQRTFNCPDPKGNSSITTPNTSTVPALDSVQYNSNTGDSRAAPG